MAHPAGLHHRFLQQRKHNVAAAKDEGSGAVKGISERRLAPLCEMAATPGRPARSRKKALIATNAEVWLIRMPKEAGVA